MHHNKPVAFVIGPKEDAYRIVVEVIKAVVALHNGIVASARPVSSPISGDEQ